MGAEQLRVQQRMLCAEQCAGEGHAGDRGETFFLMP